MWWRAVCGREDSLEDERPFITYGATSRIDACSIRDELLPGSFGSFLGRLNEQQPSTAIQQNLSRSISEESEVTYLHESWRQHVCEEAAYELEWV